jgi:hypothetical protein
VRALVVLAAMVAIGVGSTSARADGVGVVVTGDATIQPQLAAQIEDWLRQRGHELVAAPLRPDALGTMIDCFVIEDLACARKVFDAEAQSSRLFFAKIDLVVTGTTRDITITAYSFARGTEPMAARRTCAACTNDTIRSTVDDVMTTLAGKARVDVGALEITKVPANAHIRIDGKDASDANDGSAASLPPGDHVIEATAPGYKPHRQTVAITGGETSKLAISLEAERTRSKLPLAGAGIGVAMLVSGVVLYATSEEDTGEKPEYRDTRAGGVVLAGIGAAAIIGCAWWYLHNDSKPESSPSVAAVPGGATVGWAGAF